MTSGRHSAAWFGAMVCLALCWPGLTSAQVRDSASIVIIESSLSGKGPALYSLGPQPLLDLGGGMDAHEQFHRVRAAVRLPNGVLVVANAGSHELRAFTPAGAWAWSVGRKGVGPGEFTSLEGLALQAPDTLLVFDEVLARVSVVTAAGRFVRTTALTVPGHRVRPVAGVLGSGALLGAVANLERPSPTDKHITTTQTLYRFAATGPPAPVGVFFENEILVMAAPKEYGGVIYPSVPFARHAVFRTWNNQIFAGDGAQFEIRQLADDGAPRRIIRLRTPERPVTEADKDAARRADLETTAPKDRPLWEQFWATVPYPKTHPAFERFEITPSGRLWVERPAGPADSVGSWVVFSPDGRLAGEVFLPRSLQVLSVTDQELIVRARDADDVEHVQVYALNSRRRRN